MSRDDRQRLGARSRAMNDNTKHGMGLLLMADIARSSQRKNAGSSAGARHKGRSPALWKGQGRGVASGRRGSGGTAGNCGVVRAITRVEYEPCETLSKIQPPASAIDCSTPPAAKLARPPPCRWFEPQGLVAFGTGVFQLKLRFFLTARPRCPFCRPTPPEFIRPEYMYFDSGA